MKRTFISMKQINRLEFAVYHAEKPYQMIGYLKKVKCSVEIHASWYYQGVWHSSAIAKSSKSQNKCRALWQLRFEATLSISLVCIRTKRTKCFCITIKHQAILSTWPPVIWPKWKRSWAFHIPVIWSRGFLREKPEHLMELGNLLKRSDQRNFSIKSETYSTTVKGAYGW